MSIAVISVLTASFYLTVNVFAPNANLIFQKNERAACDVDGLR